MLLILSFVWSLTLSQGFCAQLTVEEQEQRTSYVVHFKEGALRIEPESEEDVYLLIDVEKKTLTIVETKREFFCRADGEGLERLKQANLIRDSWFPWVYQVSPDLLEQVEIRERGSVRLPNGTRGRKTEVYSKTYDRVVAEYWIDPESQADLFFQWRKIYFDLWSESEGSDEAQRARLRIYDQLKGMPWRAEERFRLLTQPRVINLEEWRPIQEDSWTVPEGFTEKNVAQLVWEDLIHRFEQWFRPKDLPGEGRSWTSRIR